MAWSPQHFPPARRDVTTIDFDALAGEWSEEMITLQGGTRALAVREPIVVNDPKDGPVIGDPGDYVTDHRQRMERVVVSKQYFETVVAGGAGS